jgi:uncharacterized membrane protein YciS (DUF1049 family)
MSFKTFLRTLVFLAMLFVVLYAGMNNTETISFSFPLAFEKPVHQQAGIIFFVIFAVGVLAGTMLHGGGKGRSSSKDK